jgi:hypothetical protein
MHHVRSSLVTVLIVLTGLLACAASASAYGEKTFQIVYDNDPTLCLQAVKNSSGVWGSTQLGFCQSKFDPNRTTQFAFTGAVLRPVDQAVDCIGGPPCVANRCIDGDSRLNFLYLMSCSGTKSQRYEYTGERQLANANGMCISGASGDPGDTLRTVLCGSDSRQRWTLQ